MHFATRIASSCYKHIDNSNCNNNNYRPVSLVLQDVGGHAATARHGALISSGVFKMHMCFGLKPQSPHANQP